MSDEEILPSDEEELEEMLALRQDYWTDAARSCGNLEFYGQYGDGTGRSLTIVGDDLRLSSSQVERQPSPLRLLGTRTSRSDDESTGRPRKRVKLGQSYSAENVTESQSASLKTFRGSLSSTASGTTRALGRDISNVSPSGSPNAAVLLLPVKNAFKSPTPDTHEVVDDIDSISAEHMGQGVEGSTTRVGATQPGTPNHTPEVSPPASLDPLLLGSQMPGDYGMEYHLKPQQSSRSSVTPSPSPTADPLNLFSSPSPSPPKPRRSDPASNSGSNLVSPQDKIATMRARSPIFGPPRPSSYPSPSLSSPGAGPSRVARTPSPVHGFSSPLSSPEHDPVVLAEKAPEELSQEQAAFLQELQNQDGGRYSFRRRQPRQIKPYQHEYLVYKQSMKGAAPEAIVKFSSRRRRSRSPGDNDPESDPDVDPGTLEQADSEDDRPRRKRRTKSVSEDEGSISPRPSPKARPASTLLPPPRAEPPAKQYPKSMQVTFDSSDDDSNHSGPVRPSKVRRGDKDEKLRKKPFPMRRMRKSKSRSRTRSEDPEEPPDLPVAQDSDHDEFGARAYARVRSSSPIDNRERVDWQTPSEFSSSPVRRRTSSPDGPPTSSHVSAMSFNDIVDDDYAITIADDIPQHPVRQPSSPSPSQRSSSVELIASGPSRRRQTTEDRSSSAEPIDDKDLERALEEELGRKRFRYLKRTMPLQMIKRLVEREEQESAKRTKEQRHHIEDGPLKPGQARKKAGTSHRDREIRGDEESSDNEMPQERSPSSSPPSSFRRMPARRSRTPPRRTTPRYSEWIPDTIVISSDESEVIPDEDDEIRDILYDGGGGAVKERSLINYLLPRGEGRSSQGRGKSSKPGTRAERGNGSRGVKRKRVEVAVGGSRRRAGEQQTLLDFVQVKLPGKARSSRKRATREPRADPSSRPIAGPSRIATKFKSKAKSKTIDNPDSGPSIDITVGMHQITTSSKKPAWKKDRHRTRDRVYFSEAKHPSTVYSGRGGGRYTTTVVEVEAPERQSIKLVRRILDARPVRRQRKGRRKDGESMRHSPSEQGSHEAYGGSPPAVAEPNHRAHSSNIYLDISKLPSGIAFARGTYLGSGYLHAMFTPPTDAPGVGYIGDDVVTNSTSTTDLRDVLDKAFASLLSLISESQHSVTAEIHRNWQGYLHHLCLWSRWHLITCSGDELQELRHTLQRIAKTIFDLVHEQFAVRSDDSPVNLLTLDLQWTALELLYYMLPPNGEPTPEDHSKAILDHVKLIMQHLWAFNKRFEGELYRLPLSVALDYKLPRHRIAELWVCVIQLTLHFSEPDLTKSTFWDLLSEVIDQLGLLSLYGKQTVASEALWTALYGLSALSQFSLHGLSTSTLHLPACWKFVAWALKKLNIANDLVADSRISEEGLKRRDKFFKVLVGRCAALCERWNWPLDNSLPMLEQLLQRFKARRFGNLRGEKAVFPSFMIKHDLSKLHEGHDESDTAFYLFLKLVVRAASTTDEHGRPTLIHPLPSMVRKLLALAVPLGTVPFTESAPASNQELAMLYNRFTVISVAIYLERTEASVGNRLAHAARYVELKNTNWPTRRVCVEGWTHMAILLQHLRLPSRHALQWFTDMASCAANEVALLDDNAVADHPATAIIVLLLDRMLTILETPRMDREKVEARYPDLALLDGPWIPPSGSKFATVLKVRNRVRILVEAFLKARTAFFPNRPRPIVQPVPREESQDSQDMWQEFDMDFEEFALPGMEVAPSFEKENAEMDKKFAELIDKSLMLCVHNQVTRQCKVVYSTKQDPRSADRWLEYYINVALVVVQNKSKDWGHYIAMGPVKWTWADYDASTLREWQIKLMLTILRVDPPAYAADVDGFINYLFECIVLPLSPDKPTHVPDYIATVFTLDGLKHRTLVGIPCPPADDSGLFQLTLGAFLDNRVPYLERIFLNMESILCDPVYDPDALAKKLPTFLKSMAAAIQEAHKNMHVEDRKDYTSFCTGVAGLLAKHPKLSQDVHVRSFLIWTTEI